MLDHPEPANSVKAHRAWRDGAHPVDLHVGRRLREIRTVRGESQDATARAVGYTFQQLQKYEKGGNRISASVLYALARHFGVPIGFFFDGIGDATPAVAAADRSLLTLARLWPSLDATQRAAIVNVARACGGLPEGNAAAVVTDAERAALAAGE